MSGVLVPLTSTVYIQNQILKILTIWPVWMQLLFTCLLQLEFMNTTAIDFNNWFLVDNKESSSCGMISRKEMLGQVKD